MLALSLIFCGSVNAKSYEYEVRKVDYKNLVANGDIPKATGRVPVVIAIGGSEGGISTGDSNGEMIAPHAVAVLGLAYFKEKGIPEHLRSSTFRIWFKDALAYLEPFMTLTLLELVLLADQERAELALLLASKEPRIKSVVATTPSSVAWYVSYYGADQHLDLIMAKMVRHEV